MEKTDINQEDLVTVYRVEDENGSGPYFRKHEDEIDYVELFNLRKHNRDPKRPSLDWDFDYITAQKIKRLDYAAGFLTIKQLVAWFGGNIRNFYNKSSLRVVKYHVNSKHIEHSNSGLQIFFLKPKPNENSNTNSTDIIDDISF